MNTLEQICADKTRHIAAAKADQPLNTLKARLGDIDPPRGFARALRRACADGGYGLIAEIKKASPSKGLIRAAFDPPALARAYRDGGAACLSVLTDGPYFQGGDNDLIAARAAVDLPCLRKDFMLDPYQIVEARTLGADCVLIIMAALDDARASELIGCAHDLGMDALVEVHNAEELARAARLPGTMIGINNRDLKSLKVDPATTLSLAPIAPADRLLVAESGLSTGNDLARCAAVGVRCFLVGESLMRQHDVAAATRRLLTGEAAAAAGADR